MPITPLKEAKEPPRILCQGPPRTGKTTFFIQLAEFLPKRTIFFDWDRKLASHAGITPAQRAKIDVWVPRDEEEESTLAYHQIGKIPKSAKNYLEMIKVINSLKVEDYSLGVTDTLTNLGEHLERMILQLNQKSEMEFKLWDNLGTNFVNFVQGFNTLPFITAILVHDLLEKDEKTGAITTTPTIRSKKRYTIAKDFSEVYHFEGSNGKDFVARTEGNSRFVASTGLSVSKPIATLKELQEAILKEVKG